MPRLGADLRAQKVVLGFRLWGFGVLGFRVLGFWILGFGVLGFRTFGFRVYGCRFWGLGRGQAYRSAGFPNIGRRHS